jgi:hypothetical protein
LSQNLRQFSVDLSGKLADARREYSRVLVETAEQMVDDRNHGGVFPMTAEGWLDESSRAIDSILEVGAVAGARVVATSDRTL